MTKKISASVFCILLLSMNCWAADPVQFIQTAYQKLSELSLPGEVALPPNVVQTVMGLFDFDAFYAEAAQDLKNQMKPEEYEQFKNAFQSVFVKNIAQKGVRLSGKKLTSVRYRLERQSTEKSVIALDGRVGNDTATLQFTVKPTGGSWKIVDLAVEGAGLARNYRAQFNRIYRTEGYSGLINRMKRKLASM